MGKRTGLAVHIIFALCGAATGAGLAGLACWGEQPCRKFGAAVRTMGAAVPWLFCPTLAALGG